MSAVVELFSQQWELEEDQVRVLEKAPELVFGLSEDQRREVYYLLLESPEFVESVLWANISTSRRFWEKTLPRLVARWIGDLEYGDLRIADYFDRVQVFRSAEEARSIAKRLGWCFTDAESLIRYTRPHTVWFGLVWIDDRIFCLHISRAGVGEDLVSGDRYWVEYQVPHNAEISPKDASDWEYWENLCGYS